MKTKTSSMPDAPALTFRENIMLPPLPGDPLNASRVNMFMHTDPLCLRFVKLVQEPAPAFLRSEAVVRQEVAAVERILRRRRCAGTTGESANAP